MNITFFFGNGFDRQLGLKTSYSDFLKTYVKEQPTDTDVIKSFKKYLISEQGKEFWSDAEIAMGDHLGMYTDATIDQYTECIENFENCMAEYLDSEQEQCDFQINSDGIAESFANFLENSFRDVLNNRSVDFSNVYTQSNNFNFLTLNYTLILERLLSSIDNPLYIKGPSNTSYQNRIRHTTHIHGELDSQIIMGVNDASQLNLSGGVSLSEEIGLQMIKPQQNKESGARRDVSAKQIIEDSNIIVIYGVSYGSTDAMWWDIIQKWLRSKNSHCIVAFVRDIDAAFNRRLMWPEIRYEARKRKEILSKLGVTEHDVDYSTLSNQIYIVLNTQRLNLKELIHPPKDLREKAARKALEHILEQEARMAQLQTIQSNLDGELQKLKG